MKPENLKEIEEFCNHAKSQKPNITNDELKILLAEFMEKKQISVAEVIEQVKTTQKKACSACGVENEADVVFCIACGQALESEEKSKPLDASTQGQENDLEVHTSDNQPNEAEVVSEPKSDSLVCKQCGAVLEPGATFCTSCGAQTGDTEIKQKKYHFVGVICSYCEKPIEIRQEVTVCPQCGEPHHTECWVANNYACSLPDCDGREQGVVDNTTDNDISANLATPKNDEKSRSSQHYEDRADTKMKNGSVLGKLSRKLKMTIGIGIALILGLFVLSSMGKSDMDINELKEAKIQGNAISVMIRQQYNENPAKADEFHRGRVVLLSGCVSKIEKNGGRYKVSIDDSSRFRGYNVYCFFDQSQAKEVGKLKIGDEVKIKTVHSNKGGNLDFSPAIIMAVE